MVRRAGLVIVFLLLATGCAYEVEVSTPPVAATSTKVFAADGSLITTLHAEQDREQVDLADISPALQRAVVAIEDARFFSHKGVDLRALLRAMGRNARAGRVTEGGSTITQQYVKNVLLDPTQNLDRKLKEAVLAFQLERKYTKETILERYLNRIYFGNGAYGVEAASKLYFGGPAKELDLAASALLAGLIAAPERYDPFDHPDAALARRNVVLDRMQELGLAPQAAVRAARERPLGVVDRPVAERYPAGHFVERVKRFVLDDPRFGVTPAARRRTLFEEGLRIHTTLDLDVQARAEEAVAGVLAGAGGPDGPAGAMVILDPANGFVRALVGGPDFFGAGPEAKFDLATQGRRQAGSSFKPIVLAAALKEGVPLETVLPAPASLRVPMPDGQPDWVVENYGGSGGTPTNLTEATVASINTVYAGLITRIGAETAMDMGRALGIRSELEPYPSAVLGTNEVTVLDMASAYGSFAADGMHSEPVFVTEITRSDGSVLYRRPSTRHRVLSPAVARTVNSVLGQAIERGTGTRARIGRPAAGKTGTAQQWRDAWFVGYTPDLVGAVWVGFPDGQRSMTPPAAPVPVTGGSWPAEIWNRAMTAALAGVPPTPFPPPPDDSPPPPPPPSPVAVPEVTGLPEAEARARLEAAGLVPAAEPRPSRDRPAGAVAEQIPAAGTLAAPGSTVTVAVSTGPPRAVPVPPLLGRTVDEAVGVLRAAGLLPEVTVADPGPGQGVKPGRVWKQEPPAGVTADEGGTVRVFARG